MLVVAAPDRFRGTASASQVASAVARAAEAAGATCDFAPVADGGEGTLEALGGTRRTTTVRGPLGDPEPLLTGLAEHAAAGVST